MRTVKCGKMMLSELSDRVRLGLQLECCSEPGGFAENDRGAAQGTPRHSLTEAGGNSPIHAAGYAVECGLKSCILARMIHTAWVFGEKWEAKQCLTHDFTKLVDLAGLTDQHTADLRAMRAAGEEEFAVNWETAKKWTVSSRYEAKTEAEARQLYAAIADEPHGVLRWVRMYVCRSEFGRTFAELRLHRISPFAVKCPNCSEFWRAG